MTLAQKPIKVAFVLPTLMAGGAERVLITLMNGIDRRRFIPVFVVMDARGTLREWIAKDVPVHTLNTNIRTGIPKLIRTLNKIKPDIVISTMAAMNYAVLIAKPFLKNKPRVIIREAVIPSSIIESQKLSWLVRAAYRTLYPRADLLLAPAQCIIDEFNSDLGLDTSRALVLHNPVDVARIRDNEQGPVPDKDRLKTVHFVAAGRLHKQKGFDALIDALPGLKHPYEWTLTILGEGPEHANLEYLVRKNNLADRVFLPGLSQRPWPMISYADMFLLPSRWEGLPNVVLESLAVDTPVIAMSSAGGIAEIAALCEPGAVNVVGTMDEFITAMRGVQPNPTQRMRASLLPAHFHMDEVIKRFEDILMGKTLPLRAALPPKRRARPFGRRAI